MVVTTLNVTSKRVIVIKLRYSSGMKHCKLRILKVDGHCGHLDLRFVEMGRLIQKGLGKRCIGASRAYRILEGAWTQFCRPLKKMNGLYSLET